MHQILKRTLNVFLIITTVTALLCLVGVGYLWFFADLEKTTDLPHLKWLLMTLIAEIIGVIVMFAKKGIRYLPETHLNKDEKETFEFMEKFISQGSSVTIVSNRVSWLNRAQNVSNRIIEKASAGTHFEIITPSPATEDLKTPLENAGVTFFITKETVPPEARFTLINANRSGAEKLAIARGVHPEHEITVFDNNSGPQIIALAKDIIRKSKDLVDA
nr:hypothetical protein [uncultured Desulfobacter sp.]